MAYLDYEALLNKAHRRVVHTVLTDVKNNGLHGGQHLYITFWTQHAKVEIPHYLADEYPEEMTIVLEHQFWNLEPQTDGFYVDLTFDGKEETIFVPYDALIEVTDPSVDSFDLVFTPVGDMGVPPSPAPESVSDDAEEEGVVVSLDRFRKNKEDLS